MITSTYVRSPKIFASIAFLAFFVKSQESVYKQSYFALTLTPKWRNYEGNT